MKLRLYRDSLRLRLTPQDVHRLSTAGSVVESTGFAPGVALACRLLAEPGVTKITAELAAMEITLRVPQEAARDWADSEVVALSAVQEIAPGRSLKVLIEKDFECMHQEDAEPGETFFPNPEKTRC